MHWFSALLTLPYLYLVLKIYRALLKIKHFVPEKEPSAFVSVVIACRNEEKNLPDLLSDLSEQNYNTEMFEVIVVDDNSTDSTLNIARGFAGGDNFKAIINKGKGKKQALKTAIGTARGKLILTTDADCRIGKNWLGTIASFFEKHTPDMIICPVQIEQKTGFFGRFQELEFLSLQGITAGSASTGNGVMCNGANLAFTSTAYENNSDNLHFGIDTGDDVFLLHSLKKNKSSGIMWLESREALITTEASPTLLSYLRQRKRWISKSTAYSDSDSILLGIVTFLAVLLQGLALVAAVLNNLYLPFFLVVFILKAIPDYLVLQNTTSRYGRKELMRLWLPAQIVYPFYVFVVILYSVLTPPKLRI